MFSLNYSSIHILNKEAIAKDMQTATASPCFYALVIHSFPKQKIF